MERIKTKKKRAIRFKKSKAEIVAPEVAKPIVVKEEQKKEMPIDQAKSDPPVIVVKVESVDDQRLSQAIKKSDVEILKVIRSSDMPSAVVHEKRDFEKDDKVPFVPPIPIPPERKAIIMGQNLPQIPEVKVEAKPIVKLPILTLHDIG